MVRVKIYVYSLVTRAKRHLPDFTQLPPGHRTCSFMSHLNPARSIQPGCHFRRTKLFKHTSLHCPTRYPLTSGLRECKREQSALPRNIHRGIIIQRSPGSNPRSLACALRTLSLSHDAPRLLADLRGRGTVSHTYLNIFLMYDGVILLSDL